MFLINVVSGKDINVLNNTVEVTTFIKNRKVITWDGLVKEYYVFLITTFIENRSTVYRKYKEKCTLDIK